MEFVLLALAQQRVEPSPHPVLRNYLQTCCRFSPVAAEAEAAEHGIVRDDCRGSAKRATVTKIHLARLVPGASMMRLIQPRLTIRCRLKSAARATIIILARIPVAIVRLWCPAVHERPRTQV